MFEKYEYAEITIEELADIHPSLYRFCDVRDEVSYRYGSIPKAENISNIVELAEEGKLDKNISYVLYCMKGIQSMDMAYELRGMGYDAVSLKGGYGLPHPTGKIMRISRRKLRQASARLFINAFFHLLPRQLMNTSF